MGKRNITFIQSKIRFFSLPRLPLRTELNKACFMPYNSQLALDRVCSSDSKASLIDTKSDFKVELSPLSLLSRDVHLATFLLLGSGDITRCGLCEIIAASDADRMYNGIFVKALSQRISIFESEEDVWHIFTVRTLSKSKAFIKNFASPTAIQCTCICIRKDG